MMEAAHKTKSQRIAELEERVKDLERQIAWLQAHISRDYYYVPAIVGSTGTSGSHWACNRKTSYDSQYAQHA